MRSWFVLVATIASIMIGQANLDAQGKAEERPIGKIAVTVKGTVSLDGASVTPRAGAGSR